jgi:UDP-N-acetylmuramyl tripeptide synthase
VRARRGEPRRRPGAADAAARPATTGFSLVSEDADYALADLGGARWLVARGEPLLPLRDLRLAGLHNAANALAAVALADAWACRARRAWRR